MDENLLHFILNQREKLTILLENQNDIIDCCYEASIVLNINDEKIIIGNNTVFIYAELLKNKLTLALSNKLQLDSSITRDLGYYWNQDLNEEDPKLFYLNDKDGRYWIGINHFLWGTVGGAERKFAVWLYNDLVGNITFQITPLFSGTLVDWDDPIEMQAYQEWMETSYKPFFTRIIPKEVAMQWLNQANLILKTIDENTKMLKAQYEAESKNEDIN